MKNPLIAYSDLSCRFTHEITKCLRPFLFITENRQQTNKPKLKNQLNNVQTNIRKRNKYEQGRKEVSSRTYGCETSFDTLPFEVRCRCEDREGYRERYTFEKQHSNKSIHFLICTQENYEDNPNKNSIHDENGFKAIILNVIRCSRQNSIFYCIKQESNNASNYEDCVCVWFFFQFLFYEPSNKKKCEVTDQKIATTSTVAHFEILRNEISLHSISSLYLKLKVHVRLFKSHIITAEAVNCQVLLHRYFINR